MAHECAEETGMSIRVRESGRLRTLSGQISQVGFRNPPLVSGVA